jgi:hypothetical protein
MEEARDAVRDQVRVRITFNLSDFGSREFPSLTFVIFTSEGNDYYIVSC